MESLESESSFVVPLVSVGGVNWVLVDVSMIEFNDSLDNDFPIENLTFEFRPPLETHYLSLFW